MDAKVQNRLCWLKFVFFPLTKLDVSDYVKKYEQYVKGIDNGNLEKIKEGCNRILDFIIKRGWMVSTEFNIEEDIYTPDKDIQEFVKYKYYTTDGTEYQLTTLDICSVLAYMCEQLKIEWDCDAKTQWEIDYFVKHSEFAKMLYNWGLFKFDATKFKNDEPTPAAQPDPQPQSAPQAQPAAQTASTITTPATGSSYKALGPLSSQARALIGNPGDKKTLTACYKVVDKSATGKEVRAFIRPLLSSKNGDVNGVNKIFIGNSTGYSDCTCFFDDKSKAETFINSVMNRMSNPINLEAVSSKVDKNGYFELDTECGPVFISAVKLNEDIAEELNEDFEDDIETRYAAWRKEADEFYEEYNKVITF